MNKKPFINLIFATIFLSSACSEECYTDCFISRTPMYMRIVGERIPVDLVFGQNAIYDKDNIRLFDVIDGDTLIYNSFPEQLDDSNTGTLYFGRLNTKSSVIFVDFGNMDIDTLDVTYEVVQSECCAGEQFSTIKHNGDLVYDLEKDNSLWIILRK